MHYLNFDLLLETAGEGLLARVLESPAGQARAMLRAPFTRLEAEDLVRRIGRSRRQDRSFDTAPTQAAKELGGRLFEAVFAQDIKACLQTSLARARDQGEGLRIRLRLDAPGLADLPWEYLYDRALNSFLALGVETPVVRYLDLPRPLATPVVHPPFRVLTVISSPVDHAQLAGDEEWQNLGRALEPLSASGRLQFERLQTPTLNALQACLRRGPYHVLHFIGHGSFDQKAGDGALIFEDDHRHSSRVSAERLATVLHNHPSLRLVCLNCCDGARVAIDVPYSGVAQSLIQQGVPAVIAMQFVISDQAAVTFSRVFYESLADGLPVDAALAEARTAMYSGRDDVEFGAPVLYMRSPDGVLFHLKRNQPDPPPPPALDRRKFRPSLVLALLGALLVIGVAIWGWTLASGNHESALDEALRWRYGEAGRVDDVRARQLVESEVAKGDKLAAMWKAQSIFRGIMGYAKDELLGQAQASQVAAAVESRAKSGVALAALLWGDAYYYGIGVAKDEKQAVTWFEQACDPGNLPSGCVSLGYSYAMAEGVAADPTKAADLYQHACAAGNLLGCTNLGVLFEKGMGAPKNIGKALELYQRGCDGDELLACTNLAILYEQSSSRNQSKVVELYQLACKGGEPSACTNLGVLYRRGDGVAKDPAKAAELYQRGCDKGNFLGCTNLGILNAAGEGVAKDPTKAAELYQRGCDGKDFRACTNLGLLYEKGDGIARDTAMAVDLYQRGCDGGSLRGCVLLGILYDAGEAVGRDQARAAELYRRACDGKELTGCSNLGYMYQFGDGVTADAAKAELFDRQACDGDEPFGCYLMSKISTDPQTSAAFLSRACKNGLKSACSTS